MTLTGRLHQQLQRSQALPPRERIVVAVSGGLDSVVLLDALVQLQPHWQWSLTVAHLEHDWRDESEAMFVFRLATAYGLPCHLRRIAARPVAARRRRGYEEAARHERYRLLGDIAETVGATTVVTGHHRDDQAETVLYRLLRGTSPAGLQAILPVRPLAPGSTVRLVRPLLAMARTELEAEAQRRGLSWREDASNADPQFLRNRLRHTVLPLLEDARPGAARQLAQLAEWARRDEAYWHGLMEGLPAGWLQPEPDGGVSVGTNFLLDLPEPLCRRCLEHMLRQAGVADVTGRHLLDLADLLGHPQPGAACALPGGWMAVREYERLCLVPPTAGTVPAAPASVTLTRGEPALWPGGMFVAAWHPGPPAAWHRSGQHPAAATQQGRRQPLAATAWLDAAQLPETVTLQVRARQPGDRVRPAAGVGTKKLQDLLTQAKVPRRWRDQWPVVCRADTGEVLWVTGLAVAERYAATPQSAGHIVVRWDTSV